MSYIKRKNCKCSEGCKLWPTVGYGGYNVAHHPDPTLKEKKLEEAIGRQKKRTAAANAGAKLRRTIPKDNKFVDNDAAKKFEEQQIWFENIKRNELTICWETGANIPDKYMRAAIAHILPKKNNIGGFPSVATHPLNYLILSAANGSHDKTHTWSKFQEMKVWPLAVERFKKIYPYIALSERKYLPDCLLQELTEAESKIVKKLPYEPSNNIQ